MPDVTMPRLSDSMEEGTILKWLKGDGDEVKQGDELAEIETDKATMTYEADGDGTLRIVAQEGDTLPIGEVIARLLAPGESDDGGDGGGGGGGQKEASAGVEDAPGADAEGGTQALTEEQGGQVRTDMPAQGGAQENGAGAGAQAEAPSRGGGDGADGRVKASPVARRIARERGIDLGALQGSGPGGRIVKADVEATAAGGGAQAQTQEAPARPSGDGAPAQEEQAKPAEQPQPATAQGERGTAKGDVTVQDLTRTQQVIARRMAESKATIPEFTLTTEIDMEEAVALRARLKQLAGEGGVTPSYNDIVVKACARALREFPRANGTYKDGKFELFSRVNVGFAVAAHDALIVPTVFDADQKTLGEIARETRGLIGKVREGTISPPELSGGTFNVSNLGMYGISNFTAVINPPQSAILAVGAMQPKPVVVDGEVVVRQRMEVTLTCDHRILYGADAAEFLGRIRSYLEQPLTLAL